MWNMPSSARYKSALQRSTEENTNRKARVANIATREHSKQENDEESHRWRCSLFIHK